MAPSEVRSRLGGPVEADFTIEPSPMTEELRSYWVLNCTQAVLFTQSWYRRRFESHLGLGTFTDVNLHLFFPFLLSVFVSVETSTLSSSTRALPRDKEESLSLTEYQWGLLHWAFEFLKCPQFIWLFHLQFRFLPMGVEPAIAGSPGLGLNHWATATVGNLVYLRNFI